MKIKELQEYLKTHGIDHAIFFDQPNNTYYTQTEIETGILTIPAQGKPTLYIQGFEADRIKKETKITVTQGGIKEAKKECNGIIGIDTRSTPHNYATQFNARAIDQECTNLRLTKTPEEIKLITKSCALADNILQQTINNIGKLKTEREITSHLKLLTSEYGLKHSFEPIAATGANAAVPHHNATTKKLHGFTIIDFGVKYKNYCSDITRTVFVGKISAKQKETYDKVLKVQEEAIEQSSTAETLQEVHETARQKLGNPFIHGIGHSLGIEVHDTQPRPMPLTQATVYTIEPGIYYPGKYGIRIEDDIVKLRNGIHQLSKTNKDLLVVRGLVV